MRTYILLIAAAVLLAGCTQFGGTQQQETPDVIQIDGPTCTIGGSSCADTEVTKFGGPATVRLTLSNFGKERVEVDLGERGRDVLVSKCNRQLASIHPDDGGTYSVEVSGPDRFRAWGDDGDEPPVRVTLAADERLTLEWQLAIVPDDGQVSRLGYSCPLEFEASFTQRVNTSRQVQVTSNPDVARVSSLDETTTSKQPVRLKIDAPDRFVAEGGRALTVRAFLDNVGDGDITNVSSITPVTDSFLDEQKRECTPPNRDLRMFGEGPREGESSRKTCVLDYTPAAESEIRWLDFTALYSYKLPLGTRSISIQPSEAG